jgi:amino acid adenylation domain-containing protein
LSAVFERIVEQAPDQTAAIFSDESWSYRELNRQANRLAASLQHAGLEQGDRVGLVLEQGLSFLAALLGVLKLGCSYVPFDLSAPLKRLETIGQDADLRAIVSQASTLEITESLLNSCPLIHVPFPSENDDLSEDNPGISIDPSSTAYMIYTSGSTGMPKGVMQSHVNVLNIIRSYAEMLQVGSHSCLSQLTAPGYDAAVVDIYTTLLSGAKMCGVNLKKTSMETLTDELKRNGVSVLHLTPTVFRYFIESLKPAQRISSVQWLVLGGEAVRPEDIQKAGEHFDENCTFVNLYGSSECSISLMEIIPLKSTRQLSSVPIGKPIRETVIKIVDDQGKPTAFYGELCVSSPNLALGYWKQPAMSEQAFTSIVGDDRRWYRTGDLVKSLKDGKIQFCGRKDFQVKIRGYRVEMFEVEMAIESHPLVERAAVVVEMLSQDESVLHGLYTAKAGGDQLSPNDLQRHLNELLPPYMVPSRLTLLKVFPLTSTGKLDRKRLDLDRHRN